VSARLARAARGSDTPRVARATSDGAPRHDHRGAPEEGHPV